MDEKDQKELTVAFWVGIILFASAVFYCLAVIFIAEPYGNYFGSLIVFSLWLLALAKILKHP
ncbi:hypothetical protein [Roseibium sp. SCP14]|uniref:hypothetical protein n=1 Tax=Roseibium sp. SCP14 TaxID=3141375 RepID=UPI00333A0691